MTDKVDWNQPVELMDGTPYSSLGNLRVVVDDYGCIGGLQVVRNREKKVVFLNFYEGARDVPCYASKTEADLVASASRIACVRVEYFNGEGLGESADD